MERVISVVITILVAEAYAWLPKSLEWLNERAVLRLRREDQDRCREEWKADLDALPNTLIKLVYALSNLGAAQKINADSFENSLTEINALVEECGQKYSTVAASLHTGKETINKQFDEYERSVSVLQDTVEKAVSKLDHACFTIPPNKDMTSNTTRIVYQARKLINDGLDKANDRLSLVNDLILVASDKRDRVTELLRGHDVSPDTIDTLLVELARDVRTVKNILEDNKWDGREIRESGAIVVALHRVWASACEDVAAVLKH
jgi:oligoendopeptidase F